MPAPKLGWVAGHPWRRRAEPSGRRGAQSGTERRTLTCWPTASVGTDGQHLSPRGGEPAVTPRSAPTRPARDPLPPQQKAFGLEFGQELEASWLWVLPGRGTLGKGRNLSSGIGGAQGAVGGDPALVAAPRDCPLRSSRGTARGWGSPAPRPAVSTPGTPRPQSTNALASGHPLPAQPFTARPCGCIRSSLVGSWEDGARARPLSWLRGRRARSRSHGAPTPQRAGCLPLMAAGRGGGGARPSRTPASPLLRSPCPSPRSSGSCSRSHSHGCQVTWFSRSLSSFPRRRVAGSSPLRVAFGAPGGPGASCPCPLLPSRFLTSLLVPGSPWGAALALGAPLWEGLVRGGTARTSSPDRCTARSQTALAREIHVQTPRACSRWKTGQGQRARGCPSSVLLRGMVTLRTHPRKSDMGADVFGGTGAGVSLGRAFAGCGGLPARDGLRGLLTSGGERCGPRCTRRCLSAHSGPRFPRVDQEAPGVPAPPPATMTARQCV